MVLLFKSQLRVDADERNCRATCARMMELVEKDSRFSFDKTFRAHEEFYESYSIQAKLPSPS
jgi:hypothetical protein